MAYEDPAPTLENLYSYTKDKYVKDMNEEELRETIVSIQKEVEFLLPFYRDTMRPDMNIIRTLMAV